jgi:hypothetical protein
MERSVKVERSIGMGPRRGAEQACIAITDFVTELLHGRAYPDTAEVRARFEQMYPLLRFLLTTRRLAEPAMTIEMPDLQIDIRISYDPEFEEDLTLPSLVLLDKLTVTDRITTRLHGAEDVIGHLQELPAAASTESLTFELTHAGEAIPEGGDAVPEPDDASGEDLLPEDAAASDKEDGEPTAQNDEKQDSDISQEAASAKPDAGHSGRPLDHE